MRKTKKLILSFDKIGMEDLQLVGGKNASLGELIQQLQKKKIQVPAGFAITIHSFEYYLKYNNLHSLIDDYLNKIDFEDIVSLRKNASNIRQFIINGRFPEDLATQILNAYRDLSKNYDENYTDVAVRSSSTAEDLPDASFAGQQESFLNVKGNTSVLTCVQHCFASLYTDRAISYREEIGYGNIEIGISVGVQKMVRSDIGVSGVAFSLDTESGFKDIIQINASYGLGEMLVKGAITPDEFIVFKRKLKTAKNPIIEKKMGHKTKKMSYSSIAQDRVRIGPVDKLLQTKFCMTDKQVIQLAKWVQEIEDYYTEKNGRWTPMDIEWGIDGISKKLFILQARPETIHSKKENEKTFSQYQIKKGIHPIKCVLEGIAVGDKIGQGKIRVLFNMDGRDGGVDPKEFKKGEILVTDMTDPDWEPIMKKASAIITNKGGRTCHAAIVAREMGIPAIIGTKEATEILKPGQEMTASCAEGEVGKVYFGKVEYEKTEISLDNLYNTETPIMLNVGSPEQVFKFAHLPAHGVGLAREEFIINNFIKIHPLALLHHKELKDKILSDKIAKITVGYKDEKTFFINKLAQGIAKIGATFFPHDVIVRFSDFKSNEYMNLLGGDYYEPKEQNPMIGWRGASRYYSEEYREAFAMECAAIKMAREEMGLINIIPMIPFCRTVNECEKVISTMEAFGLKRGENELQVYLMAELPSNFILAEQFAKHIDGFSIGSNDLTQLTLGLDRDSSLVAHLYDERDHSVKILISHLIKVGKKTNTKVGICGQGPSDYMDFAEFLIGEGIDSISVTPDAFYKTNQNTVKSELNKMLSK